MQSGGIDIGEHPLHRLSVSLSPHLFDFWKSCCQNEWNLRVKIFPGDCSLVFDGVGDFSERGGSEHMLECNKGYRVTRFRLTILIVIVIVTAIAITVITVAAGIVTMTTVIATFVPNRRLRHS